MFHIRQRGLKGGYASRFVVKTNGNVGVGVQLSNPLLKTQRLVVTDNNPQKIDLHVMGFSLVDGKNASLLLGAETGAEYGEWGIEYNTYAGGLNFWKPAGGTTGHQGSNYHLFINNDGKVSMGLDPNNANTFNGDYKLYVAKGILTEKVKVALKSSADWADYVFKKGYELMPLDKVESFIAENGHLPNVPSAEEVFDTGIDVATMDAKLLEKIEELTLYMIDLKKTNEQLNTRVNQLEKLNH
jgi:hypothetical protein